MKKRHKRVSLKERADMKRQHEQGATIGWLRGDRWRIADPPTWHPDGVYKVLSPDDVAQIKEVTKYE